MLLKLLNLCLLLQFLGRKLLLYRAGGNYLNSLLECSVLQDGTLTFLFEKNGLNSLTEIFRSFD